MMEESPMALISRDVLGQGGRLLARVNPHLVALVSTGLIAFMQHLAGIEISFSIFYLIPVTLVAARRGFQLAAGWSVLCALAWMAVDIHSGHTFSSPLIPFWNAVVRASYFAIGAFAVSRASIASERLQSISDLKSEMLSVISHEFGNSLATLKMSAHLLREYAPATDEKQSNLLDVIERNIDGMSMASANFLNRARLESGRFSLEIQPLWIQDLIQSAAASFQTIIEMNRIDFKLSMPASPVHIAADHASIELILRNILGNALKYTPAGGMVTMGVTLEEAVDSRPHAIIWVQDSGIGISLEEQASIMSGFYRTTASRARAKGYGVGLKVTSDLVASHGSRLEVLSSPGMGARFSFRISTITA